MRHRGWLQHRKRRHIWQGPGKAAAPGERTPGGSQSPALAGPIAESRFDRPTPPLHYLGNVKDMEYRPLSFQTCLKLAQNLSKTCLKLAHKFPKTSFMAPVIFNIMEHHDIKNDKGRKDKFWASFGQFLGKFWASFGQVMWKFWANFRQVQKLPSHLPETGPRHSYTEGAIFHVFDIT